jgi:hypothetical protein
MGRLVVGWMVRLCLVRLLVDGLFVFGLSVGWLMFWLVEFLVGCFALPVVCLCLLVGWMLSLFLVCLFVGWSVCFWLVGWLVGFALLSVCRFCRWFVCWFLGWLVVILPHRRHAHLSRQVRAYGELKSGFSLLLFSSPSGTTVSWLSWACKPFHGWKGECNDV